MMRRERFRNPFMWLIAAVGSIICFFSLLHLPFAQLDARFLLLLLITACVSSRFVIQIPHLNGQITVGDTLIFVTMLMFGGEAAILVAAVDGICSSLRLYKKLRTILFNSALLALSTYATVQALHLLFGPVVELPRREISASFATMICVMALVQYVVNTGVAAVSSACQINQPLWSTWRKFYLWSSITYFAGASAAAIICKLILAFGFYAVVVTIPIIAIVYLTYHTYLKNLEASARQAEQAERHVAELSRYIAERERAERERDQLLVREQDARREAEQANRIKDEFLATLSHELRTPMTSIVGWSSLLSQGELNAAQQAQALSAIERCSRVQMQLIDDLLDVSRIISGKLRFDTRPVRLQSVIEAAIDSVRLAADAKSITMEANLHREPRIVSGDPARLQQVVWNLLSNAIKFTPAGGQIGVTLETTTAHARIIVSDTGQGIDPEFLPYVFDRFRQADGTTTRKHGGLGLGLAIVRHLVELHGGSVRAESPGRGQGTVMQVTLPLMLPSARSASAAGESVKDAAAQARSLAGVRVLVVEDECETRNLLTTMLESHGASVLKAASAVEALRTLHQSRPNVLLSDIGMPETNGYELIRLVRSLPAEAGGRIPAVSVTAFAREEDRERSLAAGFQRHICKPVMPDELVAVVANLAGRHCA
jgi:signal transduction histidine kinase/ActR/RegA family two-component response regulator